MYCNKNKQKKESPFVGKQKKENVVEKTSKLTSAQIKLYKNIFKLYRQYSDFKIVARRVSLTSEKVRQILEKGSKVGLFEYPVKNNQQNLFYKKR